MSDVFSFNRGRILLKDTDFYDKIFSEARSKTAEHNIYERTKKCFDSENEKAQKKTESEENES